MFANGESVVEVSAKLGINQDTCHSWVKQYPAFAAAYKLGLELSEAWWQEMGRLGAVGKVKINPPTWIFNMKNRFKWTDRQDTNHSGTLQLIEIGKPPSPEEAYPD
jgi:hypothetical protein